MSWARSFYLRKRSLLYRHRRIMSSHFCSEWSLWSFSSKMSKMSIMLIMLTVIISDSSDQSDHFETLITQWLSNHCCYVITCKRVLTWTFNWNFKIVLINEKVIDWINSSDLKINISENDCINYINITDNCWACCSYIELNMFILSSKLETDFLCLIFETRFFITCVQKHLNSLHTAEDQTIRFIKKMFTLFRCNISLINTEKSYYFMISLNIFIKDWDFIFFSTHFCFLHLIQSFVTAWN